MDPDDYFERWREEQELREAQPWPVFKRHASRILRFAFVWLALGLFFRVVGVEEDDSINPEFENWFWVAAMGVSCLFAGSRFSDGLEELKGVGLAQQAVMLLGFLMIGLLGAGLIFFAALLGALFWDLIL